MKKTKSILFLSSVCLVLILASLPFVAACAKPAAPAPTSTPAPTPTELTLTSLFVTPNPLVEAVWMLKRKVEERSNGELIIKVLGGSEVIDAFEQAVAVQKGVIDMAYVYPGSYTGLLGPPDSFILMTNKKVARPQELAGQKIGDGTIGSHFLSAVGISPQVIDYAEAYTPVQTGVVDGWSFPVVGMTVFGLALWLPGQMR